MLIFDSSRWTALHHTPKNSLRPQILRTKLLMSSLTSCLARRVTLVAASMFRFDEFIKHHVDLLVNTVLIISVYFIPFC